MMSIEEFCTAIARLEESFLLVYINEDSGLSIIDKEMYELRIHLHNHNKRTLFNRKTQKEVVTYDLVTETIRGEDDRAVLKTTIEVC